MAATAPIVLAPTRELKGHDSDVTSLAFSPNGQRFASGSCDKTVRVWDITSGECLHVLEGHTMPVDSVVFSPDGHLIASSSRFSKFIYDMDPVDTTVRVWNVASGECMHCSTGIPVLSYRRYFHPTGGTLLAAALTKLRGYGIWLAGTA